LALAALAFSKKYIAIPITTAWGAMTEDFSDDFKLSTGARHQ
jgi:hypothetical protein